MISVIHHFIFNLQNGLNPFLANVPILHPLKTPEKLTFSGVFRGFKMGTLARNELMHCFNRKKQNLKCYIRLGRLPAQTLMSTWQAFTPNLVTKLQETVTIQ